MSDLDKLLADVVAYRQPEDIERLVYIVREYRGDLDRMTDMYREAKELKNHYCKERGQYMTLCKELRGEVLNVFDRAILDGMNTPKLCEGNDE